MAMQVWITTTNQLKRQVYLKDTVEQFKELWYDVYLNIDDWTKWIRVNKYECVMEAWKRAIEKKTWLLFCEDDIKLCRWFWDYINDLNGDILFYSLFHFPNLMWDSMIWWKKYKMYWRLWVYSAPKLYNEQCIYVHKDRVQEYVDMYDDFYKNKEQLREEFPKWARHPDIIFWRYAYKKWIKLYSVYPELVQHIGKISWVWNRIIPYDFSSYFLDDLRETVCKFE